MAEISKIRCTQSGECYDIKDSVARASVSTLESNLSSLQTAVDNITGGGVDSYVTETELEAKNYVTNAELTAKDYSTKQYVDNVNTTLAGTINNVINMSATKVELNTERERINTLEAKALTASVSDEILTLDFA